MREMDFNIHVMNRQNQKILVCDWLITSHVIQITCSDWLTGSESKKAVMCTHHGSMFCNLLTFRYVEIGLERHRMNCRVPDTTQIVLMARPEDVSLP